MKITNSLDLNPLFIESVEVDTRHYVNGSNSKLRITMYSGTVHVVEHTVGYYDAVNIWRLKDAIAAEQERLFALKIRMEAEGL